ncbi:SDR family NAD(P)-dependent oxidoreductase [Nocardioides sp. Bht2]|uniref:SDR family NAD(P)-dependent oxidoreductase n=1 Tax=Nocardioides sp. Bht2 TaxID=3392297 RepID=UPI0039B5D9EF
MNLLPLQTGRRFIVTGATSGLGLELSRALASSGADVVMAVRNVSKGAEAAERIRRTRPTGSVAVAELDLSDLASVRRFTDSSAGCEVLINNAGVMGVPFSRSADGHEMQFATNHLGHFALTTLLLKKVTDRVVTVGSASHRTGELVIDDLTWERREYHPYQAYSQSKLAQLSFMVELGRRLMVSGGGVRSLGGHPGYTATGIQSGTGNAHFTRLAAIGNAIIGMPPSKGARSILAAALLDLPSGTYLGPNGPGELLGRPAPARLAAQATDRSLGEQLWERSAALIAEGIS